MNRREFLMAGAGSVLAAGCAPRVPPPRLGRIMTVRGALRSDALGITLPHEHVMVDFTPAAEPGAAYDRADVVETMLPYFLELRDLGVSTFVDATPAYLGRDPVVLRALSERSGVHILTNIGYYGAREDAHLPGHAFTDSVEQLSGRWIEEWRGGIDDTGIRPGFMKIGVDAGSLSATDRKLVEAAGVTHLATGLTIASHTGTAQPAFEQIDALESMQVHPSAWIWVHAHVEEDLQAHVDAAGRGAWVSFDGVGAIPTERAVELVLNMRHHGQLDRVLLSHDAGWYSIGEPGGGTQRGFTALFTELVPALRAEGLSQEEVDQLLRRNPVDALRIRVRRYS